MHLLFFLSKRQTRGVKTNVLQRAEQLIEEAVRAGRFNSKTDFLRQAGYSSGYFGERRSAAQKNPDASMGVDTAQKFAAMLGVPVSMLLHPEQGEEPPLVDKYPGRAFAITAARMLQWPEAAIQVVLRDDPGEDFGRMYWFRRIEAEVERIQSGTTTKRQARKLPPEAVSHARTLAESYDRKVVYEVDGRKVEISSAGSQPESEPHPQDEATPSSQGRRHSEPQSRPPGKRKRRA
jgi:hypothetical protein